jgi:hypothetical protein
MARLFKKNLSTFRYILTVPKGFNLHFGFHLRNKYIFINVFGVFGILYIVSRCSVNTLCDIYSEVMLKRKVSFSNICVFV